MSDLEQSKREIEELFKVVPSSSIPPVKSEVSIAAKTIPDINDINYILWSNRSNQILSDYKYGESLAQFGENDMSVRGFFKRFATSLCTIISNEYHKRGAGAEELKPYYVIIESTLNLLAKEIEKKSLKDQEILSIISSLHGFITNYNKPKKEKYE